MSAKERNPILAMFAADQMMLVSPDQRDLMHACLAGLSANKHLDDMMAEATTTTADNFWPEPDSWRAAYRPYVVQDGILHIPVRGMLLHNFPWADGQWATGYEYIERAFKRGCEDFKAGNIKGIAFISHSGGGQVAGCWDTVEKMEAMKAESGVPVQAFAHEAAYSAAYGTIAIADKIHVSRSGGVGSIGTVRTHIDWSKANERMGLTYTFVQAGKFKTDGHPDKPLSDSAIKRWEEQITELNEIFVAAVSRNRGLDAQVIRDFEAATFSASQAVSNGLADSVGSLDDALAAYAADLSSTSSGDEQMSTQDTAAETQAAIEAAVADANAKAAEAQAKAVASAVAAEKQRVAGITSLDESKGRETLANHLAMNTAMSVDDAKAVLAAAPVAAPTPTEPAAETDALGAAMAATGDGPGVGSDATQPDAAAKEEDGSADLALAAAVGLRGFAKTAK